jgi:hypothetical protein
MFFLTVGRAGQGPSMNGKEEPSVSLVEMREVFLWIKLTPLKSGCPLFDEAAGMILSLRICRYSWHKETVRYGLED